MGEQIVPRDGRVDGGSAGHPASIGGAAMKNIEPVRDWPLVAENTAVLVVDVQQSEMAPDILRKYPEYARAMSERMLPNLSALVRGARENGCEIVYTVIEALTEDGRDVGLDHKLSGILVPKGSPGAALLEHAVSGPADNGLPTTSSGGFPPTPPPHLLPPWGNPAVGVAGPSRCGVWACPTWLSRGS